MPCRHEGGADPCVCDSRRGCVVQRKAYREANRDKYIAYRKAYYARPDIAYNEHIRSVARKQRTTDLTFAQFSWLISQPCAYCGEAATGVDRVKNEWGYTLLNSVPCCKDCNMMKKTSTVKAFVLAINAAAKHSPSYETFKKRWLRIRRKLCRF